MAHWMDRLESVASMSAERRADFWHACILESHRIHTIFDIEQERQASAQGHIMINSPDLMANLLAIGEITAAMEGRPAPDLGGYRTFARNLAEFDDVLARRRTEIETALAAFLHARPVESAGGEDVYAPFAGGSSASKMPGRGF